MSVWKFIEGDTYTDGRLGQIRKVYVEKSIKALTRVKQLKSFEKYGLPGYRFMMLHAKQGYEDAMESLDNIDKAIEAGQEIKDRDIDIETNAK